MTVVAAAATSSPALWYATRSTGLVAFVLLTVTLMLGIAATKPALAHPAWPRFATQALHRNISLLALTFLLVHILTTLADTFVHVGWLAWVVPFASGYRTFWVGLGTLAFDLVAVLIGTSLVRHRLPVRAWRGLHLTAYAVWPLAFVHFLGTGTDAAHGRWGLLVALAGLVAVGFAVGVRWLMADASAGRVHSVMRSAR